VTLLLLVRHGITDVAGKVLTGQTRGVHLNDRGREQARALVERLERVPVRALYSSPLERCRETAAPLVRARGLTVRVRRDLIEPDFGEWTGRSIRQLARTKVWRSVQHAPSSFRFPGGESLRGVQTRAVDAVRAIAAEHPRGTVVVVTHADVIRLVLADLAGLHLDLYQRLVVDPGSVSAVTLDDGRARILKVNDTGDLGSLAPAPDRRPARRKVAG
jgi:probable phosphomutase (TIGR03848 family)